MKLSSPWLLSKWFIGALHFITTHRAPYPVCTQPKSHWFSCGLIHILCSGEYLELQDGEWVHSWWRLINMHTMHTVCVRCCFYVEIVKDSIKQSEECELVPVNPNQTIITPVIGSVSKERQKETVWTCMWFSGGIREAVFLVCVLKKCRNTSPH